MKFLNHKNQILFALFFATFFFLSACTNNKLTVDEEKLFLQVGFKFDTANPENAGWQVTLKPDGVADILPGGDIAERGTYQIKDEVLSIKTDNDTFNFDVVSEREIKEKKHGIHLNLVKK